MPRSNCIQPALWEPLKCRTFGSEMLQYEADLKNLRYFGCDIPKSTCATVGVYYYFVKTANVDGKHVCDVIAGTAGMRF